MPSKDNFVAHWDHRGLHLPHTQRNRHTQQTMNLNVADGLNVSYIDIRINQTLKWCNENFITRPIKKGCAIDHRDKRQCVCRFSTATPQEGRWEESVGVLHKWTTTEFIQEAKSVESAERYERTMLGCAVRGTTPSRWTYLSFGALVWSEQ